MFSIAETESWISDLRCYRAIKSSIDGWHDHIAKAYQQQWPNFIIIGSAKSATTTLATVLGKHPEIQISASMEPKFLAEITDVVGNGTGSNSPVENTIFYVGKQARCTPPLTAPISTHHNSSATISESFR